MIVILLVGAIAFVLGLGIGAWGQYQSEKQLPPKPEVKALPEGPSDILVVNLATGEETRLPVLPPSPVPPKKGVLLSQQLQCLRCKRPSPRVLSGHAWCECGRSGAERVHAHGYCVNGCGSEWLEEVPNNYDS